MDMVLVKFERENMQFNCPFCRENATRKASHCSKSWVTKRNFTHINDIVSGLILVGERGSGDEFGIGSPKAYTIKEVAEMFGGEIEMLPERPGNRLTAEVLTEKTHVRVET